MLTQAAITKGSPAEFTLIKSELAAIIPNGHYFADSANWRQVILHYQSSGSHKQNVSVRMDASPSSPLGNFSISARALDSFEIKYISIYDFDGGKYIVTRDSLPEGEFDVALAAIIPGYNGSLLKSYDYSAGNPDVANTQSSANTNFSDGLVHLSSLGGFNSGNYKVDLSADNTIALSTLHSVRVYVSAFDPSSATDTQLRINLSNGTIPFINKSQAELVQAVSDGYLDFEGIEVASTTDDRRINLYFTSGVGTPVISISKVEIYLPS